MVRIAVTGSSGVVGRVLVPRLADMGHEIVPIDIAPDGDYPGIDILSDKRRLLRALFHTKDTVLHLAGVWDVEHFKSSERDPRNMLMFQTVMHLAASVGVRQFVHASSVHVEDSLRLFESPPPVLIRPEAGLYITSCPSGYGYGKRMQERALQSFARHFVLGAVSVRFGCMRADNQQPSDANPALAAHERAVWLDNDDAAALIDCIVNNPQPRAHDVLYATSDNPGVPYDLSNRFGWTPQHGRTDLV